MGTVPISPDESQEQVEMPKMKLGRKGKFNLKGDMKRGAGSKKSGKSASVKSM